MKNMQRTENEIIAEATKFAQNEMGWFGSPWSARGVNPTLDALLDEAIAAREPISAAEIDEMDALEARMAEYEEEGR